MKVWVSLIAIALTNALVSCSEADFSTSSNSGSTDKETPQTTTPDSEHPVSTEKKVKKKKVKGDDDSDVDLAESGDDDEIDVDESEVIKDLSIDIDFTRLADNAGWTNCLYITVNSEAEIYLGCNKGDLNPKKTLTVKSKPFCNVFKFRLTSNGATNFTTGSSANVRYETNNIENMAFFKGIKFFPVGEDGIGAHVNDNGDDKNHTDTSFQIVGIKGINYQIENTIKSCK